MVSFLKRSFTSCSITRACTGPISVGMTQLKGGGGVPNRSLIRPAAPADHLNLLRGREVNIVLSLEKLSQDAPVYTYIYIYIYIYIKKLYRNIISTSHSQMKYLI